MYHHQKMSAFDLNAIEQLKDCLNDYLVDLKKYTTDTDHGKEVVRINQLFAIVTAPKNNISRLEKFAVFRCLEEILLDYTGFGSINPGPRSIYKINNLVEITREPEDEKTGDSGVSGCGGEAEDGSSGCTGGQEKGEGATGASGPTGISS